MDNKLLILIKGKLDISDLSQAKIDQQLKNLKINLKSTLDLSQQSIDKFKQDVDKLAKSVKVNLQVTVDQATINNAKRTIQASMGRLTNNNNSTNILNAQDIENQVKRINNSLDRLKINKDKVFADTRVSSEVIKLREMENAFRRGEVSARQYGLQLDTLRTRVAQVSGEFRNTNKDGYAFSEMLTLAAKKIAIWGISTNIVYGSLNQLKKGISFVSELDNSLNQVRIVTGKTQVEVEKLAQSYNKLGKEMSVSTKEIASTSADLYRQGLSDSDVEDRMKSIIQYAKISSISLKESNTIITATANATGESVSKIIDIFALLGDTTASGADEIGEALQRVASASESSNISLEKSASWLATISSITRESASTIGRSLNSAISRYESIKSTGFNSEDSTKLNDVIESLSDIGIKATDSEGQLLDFANVMDMVGARFDTLSKNEKAYITTTMFGTFQRNRGLTLLNNYSDSLKNYENALNASGTSEQKFAIYQESTGARLERLKASWESFWQSSLDSGVIKGLIDATTILIDTFGNLSTIIMSVVTVLALWKGTAITASIMTWVASTRILNIALADNIRYMIISKGETLGWTTAQVNAAIATNGFKLALNGLKVAFLSNPIGIIAVVLTTAIGLFDIFSSRIDSASQKQKQVVDDLTQSINKLKAETNEIPNLISTYEELSKVTLKTAEQKDKLSTATAKLSSLFEGSVTGFTAEGKAAELDIAYIKQLTEQKERLLKTQQQSLATTFDMSGNDNLKKLQDDQKEMDSLNKKLESYKINMDKMSSGETPSLNREKGIQDYKDMIDGVVKQKATLEATIQSETATFLNGAFAVDQLSDSTNKLSKSMQNDLTLSVINAKGTMSDFTSATTALESINITKIISDITENMNKMSKEGKSTVEIQDYLKDSLDGVGEKLIKLGTPIPIIIELIKQLNNDFTLPEASKAKEKLFDLAKAIESVDSSTEKYLKNSEDLASTVAKMNEGHKLTTQELYKLIKAHPELIDAITKENGVLSLNKDAIESVMNANDIAFKSKLESDRIELENQKNLLMKKLYLYGQDIKGIKSVAEAKRIVSEQFNSAASLADPEVRSIYQKNQSVLGDLQAIEDQIKTIGVVSQITPKDLVSAASPSLNKKDKEEKELSIESTTQALITQIQQEYLLQKAKSDSIQKDLTQAQSQKDYAKTLELTNSLIASQRTEMELLQSARSKINQLKDSAISTASSQFGNVSDRWFIGNDNQKSASFIEEHNKASEDTRKIMDETFDSLQLLRNAWMSNKSSMEENIITQKEFAKQSREDLIKSIEEQSQALSSSETKKLESSFKNLDIESWIESNITATSEWADVTASLQEELAKLGNPTTFEGQKKYNEYLQSSAKLASEALKSQIAYQKEIDKIKQNALFESTDANLQEIMDKIDAVDQAQQLSKGGISSAVPKIDMEIVPRIDYKSVKEAIAEIPKPNEDEYEFTLDTTFVEFINNEFANAVTKAQEEISDLKSKITTLGEATPENKEFLILYYKRIQDQVQTLSDVAEKAKESLRLKLDSNEISQEEFTQKMQAIKVADIEVLAIPKIEITAEATQGINKLQEQMKDIVVDADTKLADEKLAILLQDSQKRITAVLDDIAATQAILMLQQPTSSVHTIYVQTVEGKKPEGFAKGTDSAPGGLSKVGEKGREIIQNPDGSIYLSGDDGEELVVLQKGAKVTPNDETEKILKSNNGKIPAYAEGTGSHLTDIDYLNNSLKEFSNAIADVTKEITKTTRIVTKDNRDVENSNKKIAGYQATIEKYSTPEYADSERAQRKVASAQRGLEKEEAKNSELVTKQQSDKAILDAQNATKTDYTQKIIATQKALANLNSAQYIEQKISLYQEAITVASANIDELYDSIAKYKNDDGTYEDNETTRSVLAKIKSNYEAQKSAQLSIKQLVEEKFKAEYEGFEKVQKLAENQASNYAKTLEFQKLISASVTEQLATEEAILKAKEEGQASLIAEQAKLLKEQAEAENNVKSDLAKVDPNYTDADLQNALKNSQEYNQATDKLAEVVSSLLDYKNSIMQVLQEIGQIRADAIIKPFTDSIAKSQHSISILGNLDTTDEKKKAYEYTQEIGETLADEAEKIAKRIFEIQIKLNNLDPSKAPEEIAKLKAELDKLTSTQYQLQIEIISNIDTLISQLNNLDVSGIQEAFDAGEDWQSIIPITLEGQKKYNALLKEQAENQQVATKAQEEYNKTLEKTKLDQLLSNTDGQLKDINDAINLVDHFVSLGKDGTSKEVPKIDYVNDTPHITPKTPEEAGAEVENPANKTEYTPPKTFVDFINKEFSDALKTANSDISKLNQQIDDLGPITEANVGEFISLNNQITAIGDGLKTTYENAKKALTDSFNAGTISAEQFNIQMQQLEAANISILVKPGIQISADVKNSLETAGKTIANGITDAYTTAIAKLDPTVDMAKIAEQYAKASVAITDQVAKLTAELNDPATSDARKIVITAEIGQLNLNLPKVNAGIQEAATAMANSVHAEFDENAETIQTNILKLDPTKDKEQINTLNTQLVGEIGKAKDAVVTKMDELQAELDDPNTTKERKVIITAELSALKLDLKKLSEQMATVQAEIDKSAKTTSTTIDIKGDATSAKKSIKEVTDGKYKAEVKVNAETTEAQKAIDALKKDVTATLTVNVVEGTNTTKPNNKSPEPYAKGTNSHHGGLAVVNF